MPDLGSMSTVKEPLLKESRSIDLEIVSTREEKMMY